MSGIETSTPGVSADLTWVELPTGKTILNVMQVSETGMSDHVVTVLTPEERDELIRGLGGLARGDVEDLQARLTRAETTLMEASRSAGSFDWARLQGKAQGAKLALSYLQDHIRAGRRD